MVYLLLSIHTLLFLWIEFLFWIKMPDIGTANYYHQAALEQGLPQEPSKCFDDDGRLKRTGNLNVLPKFQLFSNYWLSLRLYRDCLDGKCTHHYSGDWLRRPLLGLGNWSAWMGCWSRRHVTLLVCYLLHFCSPRWLLPLWWSHLWKAELHLYGCCPS